MAVRLDGWTTDQLLTEVIKRTAGDATAVRLIHGTVLRAWLTARDRESAPGLEGDR